MHQLFDIYTPFILTLKLALVSTFFIMLIAIPMAYLLTWGKFRGKRILEAIITLPMVLPPTVLGFYLLLALGAQGPLGEFSLAFSFTGLVVGSVFFSLPFALMPLQRTFEEIGERPLQVAMSLGANSWNRFTRVILPLAKIGLFKSALLGFAHTIGEFGVVLMIGGNIPGKTQVLSIALYEAVETLNYEKAHYMALILLIFSITLLLLLQFFLGQKKWKRQY